MKRYLLHPTVSPYLKKVRKRRTPYVHRTFGKEIIIYPYVMSPKYDWSSTFFVSKMPNQKGKSFLEIGCGCGIISLFTYFQGARKIVAVDINKRSIKNTKANFQKYNVKNSDVFYSDVFKAVEGKFDTIAFNAPYHGTKPRSILEYGVSDPGYRALRIFMNNARNFLNKRGQIILGFSSTGDLNLLNRLIIENKYLVKKCYQETKKGWTAYLYTLEPLEFETKTQEFIYNDDYEWFKKYKSFISTGKVLKVGIGLGYASYFVSLFNENIINLDIQKYDKSLAKESTLIYNGITIPFPDNSFDAVICTYTLHHAYSPKNLLEELIRVSKKHVIIVEETYKGVLSISSLIYNDIKINFLAKQKVDIHIRNYFKRGELDNFFKIKNLKIEHHETQSELLYTKEIFIVKKV